MVRRRVIGTGLIVAVASAGGCMKVPPAPVDLPARASARASATFDPEAVAAKARQIAPPAQVETDRLDRLSLFAALLLDDPKIAEARKAIASAKAEARSARHTVSPTLTLTTEYANDPATSSPWLFGGQVDLPLDVGARRSARLRSADLAVLEARYDYAETVWSERMTLRRALIDYFSNKARLPLLEDSLAVHERQLAALQRRVEQGELAGVALYPYQAERARAEQALDEARAGLASARTAIAGVLGLPTAALAGQTLAWDGFAAPRAAPPAIDARERARAAAARPDVLRALAAYDRVEADVRLELAKQYPAISLTPGYTWERGLTKLPLSINLTLPPFDLNRSAILAAVARRDQAGAAIESLLASAGNAIEAALAQRSAAWEALARRRNQEIPPLAAAAMRADRQIANGAIDRATWASAKLAELDVQLGAIDALARVQQADAALEDAMRRPLEGPETQIDTSQLGELP